MDEQRRLFNAKRFSVAVCAAIILFSSHATQALISDDRSLIEGAKLCTRYLPRHERQYGIPIHLLAAIASTESGRYNKEIGLSLPWPWTINVEGKGYFFDTKKEAITKVHELQARGFQSIDVGCMQVNLHHHPNAFSSLEEAFDPAYNVAYAAQFLKQNFNDEGSWRKATADYHSRTPVFGEQYARLVFNSWSRIINKISEAGGKPALKTDVALRGPVNLAENWSNNNKNYYRHSYHALHMHSISVSRDTARENGVLIIRPEHSEPAGQHAAADEKFVIHNVRYVQKKDGFEDSPLEKRTKNPRIVKVQNSKEMTSGNQLTSGRSVTGTDDNTAKKSGTYRQSGIFVFDN